MHLLLLFAALSQAAEPYAGVEWRPLSRADLGWVLEDRTSGTGVGEFDGTVRPSLQAHAGMWLNERVSIGGSLGLARLQQTSASQDIWRRRHWAVLRPGVDLRLALAERAEQRAVPWVLLGAHVTLPSVREVSPGYTSEEQEAADRAAATERYRLGGFGGRVGAGAEYAITPGLAFAASYTVEWHRSWARSDDFASVGQWLAGEASLWLLFRWPRTSAPAPVD